MNRINGRPFGFLAVLIGGWLGSRFWLMADVTELPELPRIVPKVEAAMPSEDMAARAALLPGNYPAYWSSRERALFAQKSDIPLVREIQPSVSKTASVPLIATSVATPKNPAISAFPLAAAPTTTAKSGGFNLYAYSFWRWGDGSSGLATAGQYGGSQSGVIATWDIGDFSRPLAGKRVSLLARLSAAHDDRRDREAALGIRWQPLPKVPVTLSAEQRFRPHGQDRVAVYAAGGVDNIALPAGFDLDLYGQGGWASGRDGGYFFDGSARALRKLTKGSSPTVAAGGGLWTGGQRGAQRLDVGPSIRSNVKIGSVPLTISADWRFRIAGDASPGNGPALTLSTSF